MRSYLSAALLVSFSALLTAQNPYGRITGRVQDSAGAVVPGAAVRGRNIETGVVAAATTNGEGLYDLPDLNPGQYEISVEAKGFKRHERGPIELRLGDVLSVDVPLQLGALSEQVTVTAEAPLLESSNANLGQVIDHQRLEELPLPAGSPMYLLQLTPGTAAGTPPTAPWLPNAVDSISGTIAAGARSRSSEYMLDGTPNMTQGGQTAFAPPPEMIQEVRIQTAPFDAAVGHFTGALVNMAIKTGTNAIHGDAYYSYMGRSLMAHDFFTNRSIYDTSTGPVTQAKINQFWPGNKIVHYRGTVGGPLYIPKVYDGRNRTFWIIGIDDVYRGKAEPNYFTVPTAQERAGDFSQLLALGSQYQIYDPGTITPDGKGHYTRQPLAGNIIPANRIDPMARKLMGYYPPPNVTGAADGENNYYDPQMRTGPYTAVTSRFDQAISQNNRFYTTASWSATDVTFQQAFHNVARGQLLDRRYGALAVDDILILRSDLVLDLRAGVTHYLTFQRPVSFGFDLSTLGFPASLTSKLDPTTTSFPTIAPNGYDSLGDTSGSRNPTTYYNFAATLSYMRSQHSLRFGAEYRILQENDYNYGSVSPTINFNQSWTKGPLDSSAASPIGQALASLLFGLPTGGSIDANGSYAQQSAYAAWFVQDDWRVLPKLTINMGVRLELDLPMTERYNRSNRGFDFVSPNPVQAAAQAAYALSPIPEIPANQFQVPGGLLFTGVNGQPRSLWDTQAGLAPRVGLAYALRPTTVIRAGYGIFYDSLGADKSNVMQQGFDQKTNLTASLDNGQTFYGTLSNPFPDGWLAPGGAAQGLGTYDGRSPKFLWPQQRIGYMQRWSFGIQQQIRRVLVEAAYMGNRGARLGVSQNFDTTPRQYLSTSPVRDQATINYLTQTFPNPFLNLPQFAGSGMTGKTVSRAQLLSPYPEFQDITSTLDGGSSWYHSLQVRGQKRFSQGYTVTVAYTWSKFMEAVDKLNQTDPWPEHVVSGADRPHVLVVSGIYELPFGHGKRWFNVSGWRNQIAGGWQAQGIYQGQSGPPLGWGNVLFIGNIHDITLPASQRSPDEWFNVNAGFVTASGKQLANNIRTFPSNLSNVRGNGYNNFNLSVIKNFRIRERMRLQIRAEAVDAMNHPMFDTPNTSPTSALFGKVSSVQGSQQRQISLGAKLRW